MLLAALLAAQPAVSPPYPAADVVAAFGAACRQTADFTKARTALIAAGWEAFTPMPDTTLGKLVARGKAAVANGGVATIDGGTWRRTVAGERLELVLSGVVLDGEAVNGCRVFDFDETRAIPVAAVTALVGRAPISNAATAAVAKAVWEPGYAPGLSGTELYHIPAGSPAVAMLGAGGNVLVAQSTSPVPARR